MYEEQNSQRETIPTHDATSPDIDTLFEQLNPQDVEQFYQSYQLWSTQHRIVQLNAQIMELQQQRSQNAEWMQRVQPSSIALSVLAQLQAHGVEDIDLLDRMLERGDEWLDHTMNLLTRCEGLDMIQGDYTRWCEHALEGAYDWIDSMTEGQTQSEEAATADETAIEETEALLLHKLMSDEDAVPEMADTAAVSSPEDETVHEHTPTIPAGDEEAQLEMSTIIEFALDEQPATEDTDTTVASGKVTGPLQPRATGPLQPEEETTTEAQDESETTVVDETEMIATEDDDETIASPQDELEPEITAVDAFETTTIPGDEPMLQTQDDDAEITSATEDEAIAQTQDETEVAAIEDEITPHIQDEAEFATTTEDETIPHIQDEAELAATEDETIAQTQDETEVASAEDEAAVHIQNMPETVSVPEDIPASQIQTEDAEAIQQSEDAEATPLPGDDAPTQVQNEMVVEESPSEEVNVEQPTETLSVIRRKLKVEPVDNNVENQPQEEITQPLDEYITQAAQREEKLAQADADEHALPPIDEQQTATLVNGQQPSPQSINYQPQPSEPVLTTPAAASHTATATMTPIPTTKKVRRGWFSWLFRGRRRN